MIEVIDKFISTSSIIEDDYQRQTPGCDPSPERACETYASQVPLLPEFSSRATPPIEPSPLEQCTSHHARPPPPSAQRPSTATLQPATRSSHPRTSRDALSISRPLCAKKSIILPFHPPQAPPPPARITNQNVSLPPRSPQTNIIASRTTS